MTCPEINGAGGRRRAELGREFHCAGENSWDDACGSERGSAR